MQKYFGGPSITADEWQAICLMDRLYVSLIRESSIEARIGSTILWNAMYHIAPAQRIPCPLQDAGFAIDCR